MFNLSGSELIFLVIIALVVLGPDKLPEAMRKAGKAYADFKKMTTGFQNEMKSVLDEPMRELRETAELAKSSGMFDTKQFTDSLKDFGNTVTKPATKPETKPETKPVSGSMADATPVEAPNPPKAAAGAVAAGSMAAVTARSAPIVSTNPVAYGASAASISAMVEKPPLDPGYAMWPTEPVEADIPVADIPVADIPVADIPVAGEEGAA